MRRKKGFKVIVGSLVVSTLISSQSFAISNFLDMPSNVMDKEPINKAVENKIIKGYKGYVKPNDKLTKAEMVTILNRLFDTPESKKDYVLNDVSKNDWYYNEILKGIDSGIISLENGNINPEETVDLEMVSKFLQTAIQNQVYGFNTSQLGKLNVSVERLSEMLGNGNSKNNSKNNITKKGLKRSEFIRLIDQLVYTVVNNKGEYNLNDIDGNVLIKASEVVIKNSKIKGNLILTNIDNSKSVLVLDNVTVKETIVLRPGQKLILKNGSKVNKVIVNGSSKEIVNIYIEGNSKIKTIISDSDINLSNSKNKKIDIYTKEAYKNLPENKNKLEDPLLNDDYLIIEIPEEKPEEKDPEVKPEEKNPEVKPEEKNPEVKPEEKNPEIKPEDKDPEVKPEEKDPEEKPGDKDPEVKPGDKDSEEKPEDNAKLQEIKARIDSLPQDKEEILKSYNEIVELVVLFNDLTKDEKIYLKEEHIKLTKAMYVIQDNNILIQLEDFLEKLKIDGTYNYETIILNKDIVNKELSLIDHLSKPLDGKLKEEVDSLNNILNNEKAYKFIDEIEKLVDKNYNDKELLENRNQVDGLVNGFLKLTDSERDIVYKENHDKLEEIASRLEMLLHLELIDYLEDAISKLPEDRETLLTMEDDLDELVNSYNYLVENNLGISKEHYEKLQTSINYFVFEDADKIKYEIEKLGNDYNSIIENEDEILLLKEKYDNLEEIEKNRIGNTIDKLNTSINIIENKDIYSIGERILKIPNNKETILNYYDEIYKLIEELTPISNNEIDKFNLISEEYKYLLELREALESKVAYDIAEEIRLLPEDIDGIFREKEKINLLMRKIDPLNTNQRLLIDKEYKMLRKKVDILQGERGYNFRKKLVGLPTEIDEIFAQKEDLLKLIQEYNTLSAYDMYLLTEEYKEINRIALVLSRENVYKMQKELLNLPTEVEEIFENKEYLQGLISRYNSLSPDEMRILSNEYKHLRHVANVLSAEKGYMFVNKIQDLPEDKDVILSNQYELSALVTEFNQLEQNDKDVVYGKDKKLRYVADILASVRAIELGEEITESINLDNIKNNLNDDNYYEVLNTVGRLNEKYNDKSLYGKHHIKEEYKILYKANTLLNDYAKKLDNETVKIEENDKDSVEKEELISEIEKDLDTEVDNKESKENKDII